MDDFAKRSVLTSVLNESRLIFGFDWATNRLNSKNSLFDRVFGEIQLKSNLGLPSVDFIIEPINKNIFYRNIEEIKAKGHHFWQMRFQVNGIPTNEYSISGFLTGSKGESIQIIAAELGKIGIKKIGNDNVLNEHLILDNLRDAYFEFDQNGCVLYVNKAFEQLFFLSAEMLVNKGISDVLHGELYSRMDRFAQDENGTSRNEQFDVFVNEISKWLHVNIYFSNGKYSVFVWDVTAKRKYNNKLVESEKKFHLISDNSPMLVWTTDALLRRTFFNKAFINYTGLSITELILNGWTKFVHPDDNEKVTINIHRSFTYKSEMTFEYRMQRHDGVFRWIKMNIVPQFSSSKVFGGFIGNGVDITDIKYFYDEIEVKNQRLQFALNESRRLSNILNKSSNIIILTDAEGYVTWVNEAFTRITEYSLEEVIGKKPGLLLYGPETSSEAIEILREGIRKKEITRVEILNYSKNGRKFWLDVKTEPLYKNGTPEGYMAIEIDITKRKNDELAIKERNDKIKEFSFITSHELRHEFSKILMLMNQQKQNVNNVENFDYFFSRFEFPVNRINSIISKLNINLNSESEKANKWGLSELDEIKEICLVDDDQLTNMVHKQLIKVIMPGTPIKVFENVEPAINYLKIQPFNNRLIFLDLNFPKGKSGWDFLEDYEDLSLEAPVVILSSSIDNEDLRKSKLYKQVLEYFVKPLTVDKIHKFVKK